MEGSNHELKDVKLDGDEESTSQRSQEQSGGLGIESKLKETGIIILMLAVIFIGLSIDLLPVPFLNQEAKLRGLVEYQTGIILGSFDLAKFLFALCCTDVVSINLLTTFLFLVIIKTFFTSI